MTIDATTIQTGCWIDGHWGTYGIERLVRIANGFGFDGKVLEDWTDDDGAYEFMSEEAERAEEWLNEQLPEDHVGYWQDGEFFVNLRSEVADDFA